jgi:hypothetical protein
MASGERPSSACSQFTFSLFYFLLHLPVVAPLLRILPLLPCLRELAVHGPDLREQRIRGITVAAQPL